MGLDKVKKIVEGILKGDVEISYPPATNLAIYPESPKKHKKKKKKLKQVTEEFFDYVEADVDGELYPVEHNPDLYLIKNMLYKNRAIRLLVWDNDYYVWNAKALHHDVMEQLGLEGIQLHLYYWKKDLILDVDGYYSDSDVEEFKNKFISQLMDSYFIKEIALKLGVKEVSFQNDTTVEITNSNNSQDESMNEGLSDMYNKYYSAIDNGLFWKLVNLDPTYRGGDIAGNYARWILKLWTTNNLKEEDFYKVTEYLNDFEANKKKFPNKDIFQFKTLPDLAVGLDSVQDQELALSNKQRQRQIKKQGFQRAEKAYEDEEWQVWNPNSYEASCNLGSGTRWCTASTSDRSYYDTYSGQGILYVIINNQNPSEKYQFQFETGSFMDKDDRKINLLEFLSEHKGLKDFFSEVAEAHLEEHPELFMLVDNPSSEAISEGMNKLTGYAFKVKDNWVYQEVQLSDLMKEMDSDIADFIDIVYADETKESIWRSLTQNEEISSYVKKFFDVNMREQSLDSFLTLYPSMHGDLVNLLHRYGVISSETIKQIEDIVGYEKKDFHGSYLKYLWVPFQYYELKSDFGDIGESIKSNAQWMAEENLRYNEIYLDENQEEKIEDIMEDFKKPFEESEEFFNDVMKVFQKYKDILTDKRNKQQKLKLGHESIKAILKQLDLMED